MAKRLLELESKKLKLGELKRRRDELTDKIMQVIIMIAIFCINNIFDTGAHRIS